MMNLISGRVMVFGTFDVFHPGHRFFIMEAMRRCVRTTNYELIVVIARDVTVSKLKPVLRNTESVRLKNVQNVFPELKIILGDLEDPMKVIREYRPAMVCLGYDQTGFSEQLIREYPEIKVERIRAFKPEKYKSSKMQGTYGT